MALAGTSALLMAQGEAQAGTTGRRGGPGEGGGRTALLNVRVFDGRALTAPRTVVIDGGRIGVSALGARRIDAKGATLLPGLIDSHIHLHGVENLEQMIGYGVTTGLDMATWPPSLVDSLRGLTGLTDIRSSGTSATAPGSVHSQLPGFPEDGLVDGPQDAVRFVADRVAEGADYIKVISDIPGLDQRTLNTLVKAAHGYRKLVVAHAASTPGTLMAQEAGADILTHVPLDTAMTPEVAGRIAARRQVSAPTLTMMKAIVDGGAIPGLDYGAARDSVGVLDRAGVPILAGTDSNAAPGAPASVPHGLGLHQELELLVDAGLSTASVLRAATELPARHFRLPDRGAVRPGLRADLILVDGDPLADIRATRNITRIWAAGVECSPIGG